MSGDDSVEDQVAAQAPANPGAALKAAREAIGVSRREVAQALNLSVETLTAIEDNDADGMPDLVFARGYVRSYAKLLELDPEPLVAMLATAVTQRMPAARASTFKGGNKVVLIGAGLLVLILLAALLAVLLSGDTQEDAATVDERPSTAIAEAPGVSAPTASELAMDDTPTEFVPAAEEMAIDAVLEDPGAEPDSDASGEEVSAAVPPVAAARRITPQGDAELAIEFTADCWVEVRSLAGDRLYSRLGTATRPINLVGEAPFRVRLGYAPGASLRFNGEPVPLVAHTVDNVANLVVGQ